MAWDGLNRRKFPRLRYPCLLTVRENETQETLLTHTENIGLGGVCVILKRNLKIFSEVKLEIDLLDFGDHVCCPGKIVWNVRRRSDIEKKPLFYDIGIEFSSITDSDKKHLQTVVKNLLKKNEAVPYV